MCDLEPFSNNYGYICYVAIASNYVSFDTVAAMYSICALFLFSQTFSY